MLNLREYARAPHRLADYLPWAALVAPGVVLNKDGSFQKTFRYRGPDLESSTEAELVSVMARINNVLRRFGSDWALFFEAVVEPTAAAAAAPVEVQVELQGIVRQFGPGAGWEFGHPTVLKNETADFSVAPLNATRGGCATHD